jgi:hypothetical protein
VRLLRDGLGKLGRRPATWVTFGLLAGMMMLIFVAIGATANSLPSQPGQPGQPGAGAIRAILTFPQAYDAILAFIIGLGLLLAVIYGAAIAGSEWTWGTLKNAVARGESRAAYVALTFAAIAVMVGVGLVLAMVVGTGAAFVGASLAGIPTDGAANADALASLPVKLVRSWAGLAAAGAIGFAIATFTRSQLDRRWHRHLLRRAVQHDLLPRHRALAAVQCRRGGQRHPRARRRGRRPAGDDDSGAGRCPRRGDCLAGRGGAGQRGGGPAGRDNRLTRWPTRSRCAGCAASSAN